MENKEKIYVGNGVEKFEGSLINITINLTKIGKTSQDHIFEYGDEKYLKLKVVKRRKTDEHGRTHFVEVDTWKPDLSRVDPEEEEEHNEELPFWGIALKSQEKSMFHVEQRDVLTITTGIIKTLMAIVNLVAKRGKNELQVWRKRSWA